MKKSMNQINHFWKNRPIYETWASMPDNLLFLSFVLSSLPAFYWAYVLKELWRPYIEAVNSTEFNFISVIHTMYVRTYT